MVEYSFNGKNWTSCCVSFRHTYEANRLLVYLTSSLPQYLNLNGMVSVCVPANTILLNVKEEDAKSLIEQGIFKVADIEDCKRLGRGVTL